MGNYTFLLLLAIIAQNSQHPIKHSFCVSLRRDVHWKSLILSLLIYGCLGAIAWCRLAVITTVVVYYNRYVSQQEVSRSNPCADGYIYIPIAFVILLYLVYLVECWHCHTRIELKYKVDVQTVYYKMRQMREALPIVWWKALCYHYVRRTRQVTRYRNGDAFTSTQVYYERVNSHTSGCAFNFTNCGLKDLTKCVTGLEDFPATKIKFSKTYTFENPESKFEFDEQRNNFFVENERRDDYMETREGMDLLNVNFKDYMIAFKDPDNLPWYVSHVVFWVASCLLLTWPLRVIIEYKTAYVHFHVNKVFGCNYSNTEQQSNGRMTRVNTIASAELEMLVRNNFTIVPSYSEALLMGANATSTHTLHDANANVTSPVLGPTRSITWNNISACSSSGYISGFFSSANLTEMSQYNSCTLVNDGIMLQPDGRENQTSRTNSFLNLLRSPWTRKRQRSHLTSNRMFMLSSPESPDEYALTLDGNLAHQTVHASRQLPRDNSKTFQDRTNFPFTNSNANPSSYSLVSNHSNHCQKNKTIVPGRSADDESRDKASTSATFSSRPVRPHSILKPTATICTPGGSIPHTGETVPQMPAVFIKRSLPNVPIHNILSESSQSLDRPTPSSPPCYEAALNMQTVIGNRQRERSEAVNETHSLLNDSNRQVRRYYSMMETSL